MSQDKKKFRKDIQSQRAAIGQQEHKRMNDSLCSHLNTWLTSRGFTQVFYFLPFRNEPDLVETLGRLSSISAGLPVIFGGSESLYSML